jgi:hypothetical protein
MVFPNRQDISGVADLSVSEKDSATETSIIYNVGKYIKT